MSGQVIPRLKATACLALQVPAKRFSTPAVEHPLLPGYMVITEHGAGGEKQGVLLSKKHLNCAGMALSHLAGCQAQLKTLLRTQRLLTKWNDSLSSGERCLRATVFRESSR